MDELCKCQNCHQTHTITTGPRHPRLTRCCFNTYCSECIDRFYEGKMKCPACSKKIKFSSSQSPQSNSVIKILESTIRCKKCANYNPQRVCPHCNDNFCENCMSHHLAYARKEQQCQQGLKLLDLHQEQIDSAVTSVKETLHLLSEKAKSKIEKKRVTLTILMQHLKGTEDGRLESAKEDEFTNVLADIQMLPAKSEKNLMMEAVQVMRQFPLDVAPTTMSRSVRTGRTRLPPPLPSISDINVPISPTAPPPSRPLPQVPGGKPSPTNTTNPGEPDKPTRAWQAAVRQRSSTCPPEFRQEECKTQFRFSLKQNGGEVSSLIMLKDGRLAVGYTNGLIVLYRLQVHPISAEPNKEQIKITTDANTCLAIPDSSGAAEKIEGDILVAGMDSYGNYLIATAYLYSAYQEAASRVFCLSLSPATLRTQHISSAISCSLDEPVGITVDGIKGHVFVCDTGEQGAINVFSFPTLKRVIPGKFGTDLKGPFEIRMANNSLLVSHDKGITEFDAGAPFNPQRTIYHKKCWSMIALPLNLETNINKNKYTENVYDEEDFEEYLLVAHAVDKNSLVLLNWPDSVSEPAAAALRQHYLPDSYTDQTLRLATFHGRIKTAFLVNATTSDCEVLQFD